MLAHTRFTRLTKYLALYSLYFMVPQPAVKVCKIGWSNLDDTDPALLN